MENVLLENIWIHLKQIHIYIYIQMLDMNSYNTNPYDRYSMNSHDVN